MCFGGCDTGFGNCTGSIAYILEKLASFIAMTAVILCIIITLTISLGLGIGLGYNYCFVDMKIAKDSDATDAPRPTFTTEDTVEETTLPPVEEEKKTPPAEEQTPSPTVDKKNKKTTTEREMVIEPIGPPRARRMLPIPVIKPTMSIPLNGEFDFPVLLSKLRGRNKNVTLELIAT
ncbi:hypothetical protein PYW07_004412 [Mythimna separata]|uniref:Uncharacterized protein n=1 Tax=Mythimna separata TaxID=271217 RepID=A0AAD8DXQ1_MYTSE|nr:hypothetical protein PYW07_004412 [Mythimna separata]